MNYAKVIGSALQLFPKKIKVTLIEAATGNSLGKHKIPAEQLPTAFNRPTTLKIQDINWRVLKADPVSADDFLYTKRLILHVQNADSVDVGQLRFGMPTICKEFPIIGAISLYHDFTLDLAESDWRQIEFLLLTQSAIVEETIKAIEATLAGQPNPLLGYEQQYIRDDATRPGLAIPWPAFCALFTNPMFGNIFFNNSGFVKNGFAVKSESYTYYGILENGYIRMLCLSQFDWADDEFMLVLSTYELSLVDWCNASRISAEVGEELKSEFISL